MVNNFIRTYLICKYIIFFKKQQTFFHLNKYLILLLFKKRYLDKIDVLNFSHLINLHFNI